MRERWAKIISTVFYLGYFPFAAGSIASIIGGLIAIALHAKIMIFWGAFLLITALGFWAGGPMERIEKEKDPACVVIDEVSGAMIAFFMLPAQWPVLFTAFFLFRAFDMFEVPPANLLAKKGGGTGIMMDDIVAGIYTNIVMHIAIRAAGIT
ncbi:MAG: phosphatidylglycerophosphatase A [Candidatus Omnitrophica bacterium]|nr:phosphatidylglycerophosphatase A [Candidatus Omnitrophota bacterium]